MTATSAMERPPDEAARMAAVRRYDILDTPPDGAFDRVTRLAASVCRVPISTITIVDVDRIWFKSTQGIDVDQIGRDPGLCASAIFHPGPYMVTDASVDPRTLENPLVRGELGLRFYAAVPLTTADGYALGTLNVIDVEPRELSDEQLGMLEDLGAVVVDELELRSAARRTIELEATRAAAAFRDTLLSGVTHEMRTPLSILHGIASMDDHWTGDDQRVRDVMRRNVRHLDWLVTQFLDYGRLENGRLPAVRPEPMDLRAAVDEAVANFSDRDRIDVGVGDPPQVVADRQRVVQIVMQLLHHATRVTPDTDGVDVAVGTSEDGQGMVTIVDHGPGLAPDDLAQLLHAPRDEAGLDRQQIGLYVARALAEAQHGRLEVAVAPDGEGTQFVLRLPAAA